MSNKTFHWRTEDGQPDGVVVVTEKQLVAGPDAMMVMDKADVSALNRWIKPPVNQWGKPEIKQEVDDVVLKSGNVNIMLTREQWFDFLSDAEKVEFPTVEVPTNIEVTLKLELTHTVVDFDGNLLLQDHDKLDDGYWLGSEASLEDALRDACYDWDWFDEIGDKTIRQIDYFESVDTDPSY